MKRKFKIKLKDDREVGPFTKEQIGELYINRHIDGSEKCCIFPDGEWKKIEDFHDVSDIILDIILKRVTLDDLKEISESETVVKISLANIKNNKTESSPEDDQFKEFEFSKDLDNLHNQITTEKSEVKQHNNNKHIEVMEHTCVAKKNELAKSLKGDRTVINVDMQALMKSEEQSLSDDNNVMEDEKSEAMEKDNSEEEEKIDFNGSTEFVDLDKMLPELKGIACQSEQEFNAKEDVLGEQEQELNSETDDNNDGVKKKKPMKPIVAFAFIVVLLFLLFPDDDSDEIRPKSIKILFPRYSQYLEPSKSIMSYKSGINEYNKGKYLDKAKAAGFFRKSLEYNFRGTNEKGKQYQYNSQSKFVTGNPSLGMLILTYAELFPNVNNKSKSANIIFKLMQLALNKSLNSLNVAIGSAIFYSYNKKYQTALNSIENYLRFCSASRSRLKELEELKTTNKLKEEEEKEYIKLKNVIKSLRPSLKLFAIYLDILVELGNLKKAEEVYETLKNQKKLPIEGYSAMSKYLSSRKKYSEGKELLFNGCKLYPESTVLWLKYARYILKEGDSKQYVKILKIIKELKVEYSPQYYAEFLEYQGILMAMLGKNKKAVNFFNLSLKIYDSDELRSSLAALDLGGSAAVEALILRNKIIQLIRRARYKIRMEEWEEAFLMAIEAVDYDPTFIEARLLLAKIQTKRGYYKSALDTLNELAKQHPENANINADLINTYVSSMKLEEAHKQIVAISITKFVKTAKYAEVLGNYYEKMRNDILASKWRQESINKNPLNDESYFSLARTYIRSRHYDKGKLLLKKAMMLDPQRIDYKCFFAKILYELEGPEIAIGYLRDILQKYHGHPKIFANIAIYYYRSGQLKMYEKYKDKMEKLPRIDEEFYKFLISSAQREDKNEDVIKYALKLVSLVPSDIDTRMILGEYYMKRNDLVNALDTFNEVVTRLPTYPKAYYFMAKIYVLNKNYEKALEMAEKEIKFSPELEHGYYIKGDIHRRKGEYVKSIKNFEKAIAINGKNPEVLASLADIKHRQNYLDEAREYYMRALKVEPGNPILHKQLGHVFRSIGQSGLAIESYKIYLDLYPNAPDRRQIESVMKRIK